MISRFKIKYQSWLDLRFQFQGCALVKESSTNLERLRLSYDEGSSRLKRKIAAKVSTKMIIIQIFLSMPQR